MNEETREIVGALWRRQSSQTRDASFGGLQQFVVITRALFAGAGPNWNQGQDSNLQPLTTVPGR